jgi:tetratricopeptide (TPR) repeat protein
MRTLAIGLVAILAAGAGWAQIGGGIGGMGGGATSGGMSGRGGTLGNTNTPPLSEPSTANQRSIYISGKVVLSDGAALPQAVKIDRVCGGTVRVEGYTDLKGRFNFDLGRNNEMPDVSSRTETASGPLGLPNRTRDRSLLDCDLHFTLPGFRPETLSLANSRYLDNPDVGTIILRRIANVEGLTISATSSLAPKDAKKAFEKGLEASNKKNATEARKDFEKAVEIYPRYAAAWYELGRLDEQNNQFDDARKSYGQAVVADAKYIPPHERLAWIALRETKWQEMADDTETILRLDPIDYPDAYYLSGVANLQLGKLDVAEKSAREALERDTTHRNARAPYVLGLILAQKHDYAGAAPLLRAFLEQNPDVPDAPTVRKQLAAIEQAARGNTSASQEKPLPEKSTQEKP